MACCSPRTAQPLSQAQAETIAPLLKALADPVQLRPMSLIASPGGEACVCKLNDAFDRSQPTISHYLKALYSGLLDREKRGIRVYYRPRRGPGQPRRTDGPPVTLSRPGMNSRPHGASSLPAAPDGFT